MKLVEVQATKELANAMLPDIFLKMAVNRVLDAAPEFELVHCKDCEYGVYAGLGKFMCDLHEFVGKAYFYCADGVKRASTETLRIGSMPTEKAEEIDFDYEADDV